MSASSGMGVLGNRPLWWWVLLSFAVHLGIIWLLGERPAPRAPVEETFRTTLAENIAPVAARLPDYEDPQLFALPSPRGFSGAGWLRAGPLTHAFHEWADEQRWLALPVESLGGAFIQYVRLLTEPPPPMPRKMEPVLQPLVSDVTVDWVAGQSRLRVEGPLSGRLLQPAPQPPNLQHKEVLRPSVVELTVDERGRVFSAILVGESGWTTADELALELARQLQFQPAVTAGITLGRMVVEWHVQPPPKPAPSGVSPVTP